MHRSISFYSREMRDFSHPERLDRRITEEVLRTENETG